MIELTYFFWIIKCPCAHLRKNIPVGFKQAVYWKMFMFGVPKIASR